MVGPVAWKGHEPQGSEKMGPRFRKAGPKRAAALSCFLWEASGSRGPRTLRPLPLLTGFPPKGNLHSPGLMSADLRVSSWSFAWWRGLAPSQHHIVLSGEDEGAGPGGVACAAAGLTSPDPTNIVSPLILSPQSGKRRIRAGSLSSMAWPSWLPRPPGLALFLPRANYVSQLTFAV